MCVAPISFSDCLIVFANTKAPEQSARMPFAYCRPKWLAFYPLIDGNRLAARARAFGDMDFENAVFHVRANPIIIGRAR